MLHLYVEEIKDRHPLALAFIGDAVMSLVVRKRMVLSANMKVDRLHKESSQVVCAKAQSKRYDSLLENNLFTDEEAALAHRAFNAKHNTVPNNCTLCEYRKATALEAVIGYNFLLGNTARVEELI